MSDDIVERLRDEADLARAETATDVAELLDEAADEIERLREEIELLRAIIEAMRGGGMVLVPREPSEAMLEASGIFNRNGAIKVYRAMIDAALAGGEQGGERFTPPAEIAWDLSYLRDTGE